MRRPAGRLFTTWVVTTAIVALLGPPAGLLWAKTVPRVTYVIVQGEPLLADPEGQGLIGIDARFALIALIAGIACGVAAYAAGRRFPDMALVFGLAVGGAAAAVLAWRTGHMIGLDTFRGATRHGADGTTVTGIADLRAKGVLVFWPLLAVAAYGLLELLFGRLSTGDRRELGADEADEIGGGELDLQSAPSGRDVDGRER